MCTIGCSKGCALLPEVWKRCVPSCCFSAPCLGIIPGFCSCEKVCEFWMVFLDEPCMWRSQTCQPSWFSCVIFGWNSLWIYGWVKIATVTVYLAREVWLWTNDWQLHLVSQVALRENHGLMRELKVRIFTHAHFFFFLYLKPPKQIEVRSW